MIFSDEEKKENKELIKHAKRFLDVFLYSAAKKIMNEYSIWESKRWIDELTSTQSQKGSPQ